MDKDTINELVDDLFFSKEAAEYLGITIQRFNQLVHSGQITPIKKTSAGSLFLRSDLDKRQSTMKSIAIEMKKNKSLGTIDLESPYMQEVMNYFTLQRFYSFSDKKTEPVFEKLSLEIDIASDFSNIVRDVASILTLDEGDLLKAYQTVKKGFAKLTKDDVVVKKGMQAYPELLEMTEEAPPYLFLRGNTNLLQEKIVSVVGSRGASKEGLEKAYRLSGYLGKAGIVVASGLARGIDAAAHKASIDYKYQTIAVLGTPVTKVYPKENEQLQKKIGEVGLVVSQYPPSSPTQRWHFPMRNAVMSGISLATAIVEAGETSGALKQADYAMKQNRLVFIPQSVLDNDNISWPKRYIQRKGAEKFSRIEELFAALQKAEIISNTAAQMSLFGEGANTVYVRKLK